MEYLTNIISTLLLLGLLAAPVLLFVGIKKWSTTKYGFWVYLFLGLILTASLMLTFAWWADYSDQLLLRHYGYDFDAMTATERFGHVKSEDLEQVKELETGYYGIGWPVQAILTFAFYSHYLLIVYFAGEWIRRNKVEAIKVGSYSDQQ